MRCGGPAAVASHGSWTGVLTLKIQVATALARHLAVTFDLASFAFVTGQAVSPPPKI